MYEEDKIFGPFTFRQFLLIIGGVGAACVAYVSDLNFYIALTLSVLFVGYGFFSAYKVRPKKIEIENLSAYLDEKRLVVGDELFAKALKRKLAEQTAQLNVMIQTGRNIDPDLEKVVQILKEKLSEVRGV